MPTQEKFLRLGIEDLKLLYAKIVEKGTLEIKLKIVDRLIELSA